MRIKNYFQFICVALTMAFAVTSCGDDDPITPTPDPTPDPDPKPTVVYNGFGCSVSVDSIAGDVKTFNTIFLDSMKFYCPELKETGAGVYSASIVYEKGDTVAYKKLLESFRAFHVSVRNWIKTAKTPVVSSSNIRFSNVSQSGVSSDWVFNHSSSSSSNTYHVLIPALTSVTWATENKKDTGVESLKFNSWTPSNTVKAMFSGDVVINGTDTYSASRQGNVLIAFDENMQIKYGFVIDPSGESFNLIRIGGDQLAKEAITTYTFKE